MTREKAQEIVRRLQADLCDRNGLGFDGLDDATLDELTETWVSIVQNTANSGNESE